MNEHESTKARNTPRKLLLSVEYFYRLRATPAKSIGTLSVDPQTRDHFPIWGGIEPVRLDKANRNLTVIPHGRRSRRILFLFINRRVLDKKNAKVGRKNFVVPHICLGWFLREGSSDIRVVAGSSFEFRGIGLNSTFSLVRDSRYSEISRWCAISYISLTFSIVAFVCLID